MSNSKYLLALGYTLKETWDSIVKIHAAWPVSDLKSNRSSEDAENHRESVSMSVMKKKHFTYCPLSTSWVKTP